MTNKYTTAVGYDQEEAYFRQKDAELLARRRARLDAHHTNLVAGELKCPRCGSKMREVAIEHVKVDRCTGCLGIYLDNGELEKFKHGKAGGFFNRLFGR